MELKNWYFDQSSLCKKDRTEFLQIWLPPGGSGSASFDWVSPDQRPPRRSFFFLALFETGPVLSHNNRG